MSSEARGDDPTNRVVNPGGESGDTLGWQAGGFRTARYGESALVPPPSNDGLGGWLFQATDPQATMRQVVPLADHATAIDGGEQWLTVGGSLGGAAGSADGMRMAAQPLDGAGLQLGAPVVAGPPTAADRSGRSALVHCFAQFQAPVGARALQIALTPANVVDATTATADALYAVAIRTARPASFPGPVPGEGPGCELYPPYQMPYPSVFPQPREPACSSGPQEPRPQVSAPLPPPPGTQVAVPAPQPPPAPVCAPAADSPASPGVPASTGALRVSRLVLTSTRLSLRVSTPATVRVRLAQRVRAPAAKWRRVTSVTLHAPKAGTMTRKLRRLPPGRYRIEIRARSTDAGSLERTFTRVVGR